MKISTIFKAGFFTLLMAFSVTALADDTATADTPATVVQPEASTSDADATKGTAKEDETEGKKVRDRHWVV